MFKFFSIIIILVIAGTVYFVVQDKQGSDPNSEQGPATQSLPEAFEKNIPEDDKESFIEEESRLKPSEEPQTLPRPDANQGIDTLPPDTLPELEPEPADDPQPASSPDPVTVIIQANDITADPKTITVEQGATVTLIFQVDTTNVYFGGLDFRSIVVDTGTIKPGDSKTVTFEALASFDFTPYWPASGVAKGYKINIIVE